MAFSWHQVREVLVYQLTTTETVSDDSIALPKDERRCPVSYLETFLMMCDYHSDYHRDHHHYFLSYTLIY